ncbi:hypothetical protein [Actimicrobium antarcticum]|uniref:Uncharacterized protein n=1 Tax=Actimicrobium antarcticum TaxID=1051899 RepID=A0ABP7SS76_9BURK
MPNINPLIAAIALAASFAGAAHAADTVAATNVEARYQRERAVCLSGKSNQSQAICLQEAGAARDDARRHQLGDGKVSYEQNAMVRCNALNADDKRDCESRIRGEGALSGSVRDGGLIRETTTIVPADPAK